MSAVELISVAVAFTQPLLVGAAAAIGIGRGFSELARDAAARRDSSSAYRLYECATFSRLASAFAYSVSFLAVVLAHVVYDADVALLLSELMVIGESGAAELIIVLVYVVVFASGLLLDYVVSGYS